MILLSVRLILLFSLLMLNWGRGLEFLRMEEILETSLIEVSVVFFSG